MTDRRVKIGADAVRRLHQLLLGRQESRELEKMAFAIRKSDRALLQELAARLTATAATRDGVLSKSIPGWSN